MDKLIHKYAAFLRGIVKRDTDFVFGSIGVGLVVLAMFAPITMIGSNLVTEAPIFSFVVAVVFPIAVMIFICAVIFPLIIISRQVQQEAELNAIIVECIKKANELKAVARPGDVYRLSKGSSIVHTGLYGAKDVLEAHLGPEFEIRLECHAELSAYNIEFVKRLELPDALAA